jgi:hypothetical protein
MRITVMEFEELSKVLDRARTESRRIEHERANEIMRVEGQNLRAKVNQTCQGLIEKSLTIAAEKGSPNAANAIMEAATTIRDMLDDRPPPESDPDAAKRFPGMFRGGPVQGEGGR